MRNWQAASTVVPPLCVLSRVCLSSSCSVSSPALGSGSLSNFSHSNRSAGLPVCIERNPPHMHSHGDTYTPWGASMHSKEKRSEQRRARQLVRGKEIKEHGPRPNYRSILKRGSDMLPVCGWIAAEDKNWKSIIGFGKTMVVDLDKRSFRVVMWWDPCEGGWGGDGLEREDRLLMFKDKVPESVGCSSRFLLYSY